MAKKTDAPAPRPTWAQPDYDPSEKMIPEGSEAGYPTVRYDPETGCNFHLDGLKRRVLHGVPAALPTVTETLATEAHWVDPSV